ncbi:MAG: hypothetical protein V3571_00335 [Pseudodesulfovibrio sp.]
MSQQGLGEILAKWKDNWKTWRVIFFAVLAAMVVLNLFFHSHHGHFWHLDETPGFFAAFGLVVGLAMVIIMKKIVQPFIKRKEDYYGD